MSTVKSKKLQVGTDATATNNFTIYQPSTPDGTLRIGVGNADSPTEVGKFDSNGYVATNAPVFRAYSTVNQTGVAASTITKILFDTEEYDIGGNFASSRFTAPIDGYYHFSATTHIVGANGVPQVDLLVNGTVKAYGNIIYAVNSSVDKICTYNLIVSLNAWSKSRICSIIIIIKFKLDYNCSCSRRSRFV
jgi:hypothetical protein